MKKAITRFRMMALVVPVLWRYIIRPALTGK
jgi:hypothetical protein